MSVRRLAEGRIHQRHVVAFSADINEGEAPRRVLGKEPALEAAAVFGLLGVVAQRVVNPFLGFTPIPPPPASASVVPPAPPSAAQATEAVPSPALGATAPTELGEKHITIRYGDTGYSYESLFGAYLTGAKELTVEDPYIRRDNQLRNFIQLCELCVQVGTIKKISLVTGADHDYQKAEIEPKFKSLAESLADAGVEFLWRFDEKIHDRELRTDNGWSIRIGRGLDIYQRTDTWIQIGATNLNVRPCMETKVSIIKTRFTTWRGQNEVSEQMAIRPAGEVRAREKLKC